jgi:D-lactate dehydrogenase
MKIAVFSAQPYGKRFLEETNTRLFANHNFELTYHVFPLSRETVALAQGMQSALSSTTS